MSMFWVTAADYGIFIYTVSYVRAFELTYECGLFSYLFSITCCTIEL